MKNWSSVSSMHCITLNVSLLISRAVNYVLLKWVPPALKQRTARLRFTQMTDIIAHLEKDRSTNVIDLCQRHDQYTTFPAAWAVVAGNTKLKATSSSSRERCCSQLTFQIRGRPATLCLRNLHSAALGSAVRQCATRTALVHEKCRVHESRNRNIGDFFRPSQSSIGPHATIFGLDFGAWLFSITLTLSCSWLFGHLLSSEPIKVYLLSACGQQLRMKSKFFWVFSKDSLCIYYPLPGATYYVLTSILLQKNLGKYIEIFNGICH